jgi:hypothetical protein
MQYPGSFQSGITCIDKPLHPNYSDYTYYNNQDYVSDNIRYFTEKTSDKYKLMCDQKSTL